MMNRLWGVLLAVCMVFSSSVVAQKNQSRSGVIDAVYNDRAMIVVNDATYKMALNLSVVNKAQAKKVNRYALKKGQFITFVASGGSADTLPVINDITVFKK
ncbi:MAG: hypothetical protein KTR20_08275 [Cellvibrionaceae bacterium]|nr:hypothetical protein [Cellvibrionaceae bacterium]